MTIPISIAPTEAQQAKLAGLSRLVGRREGDVLTALLRDPDLAAVASAAFDRLLDKHLDEQRRKRGGPRPIDFRAAGG